MHDLWVVNASPLIVFSKIAQLDLLKQLPKDIVVPPAVANEIKAGPENDAARLAVEGGMFRLVETQEPPHLQCRTLFPNIEKSSIILKDIPHYT